MKIRTRLTGLFFIIIAFLLFFAFLAIYYFSAKFEKQDFYSRLEKRADSTADLLIRVNKVDSIILKLIDINKKDILYNENISVYNSDFKEIYTSNDSLHFHQYVPEFNKLMRELQSDQIKLIEIGTTQFVFTNYIYNNRKYYVAASAIDVQGIRFLYNLKIILITTFVLILIIILIAGRLFANRALMPLRKVISEVNLIHADSLSNRLPEGKNKDEIAHLIATFNELLSRIEEAVKTQKLFVSNASHELRNPLTSITAQIEVALLKKRANTEYEILLKSILEDIKRLNEMSHQLLQLSLLENNGKSVPFEIIRMDELIWEIKNEFLSMNPDYKMKLIFNSLPEEEYHLEVEGHKKFLKTCFINFFENACKFSPDKTVSVEIRLEKEFISIIISDQGPGISRNDLLHIFEPFYRGYKNSKAKGYGIGLSIARKILQIHNATISVHSEINKGSRFIIHFPFK